MNFINLDVTYEGVNRHFDFTETVNLIISKKKTVWVNLHY